MTDDLYQKCEHKWKSSRETITSRMNTVIHDCRFCPALQITFSKPIKDANNNYTYIKDVSVVEPFSKFNSIK